VFGKVDTEAEPSLVAAFRIRAIPTLVVFRDGVHLATIPAQPAAVLDELIVKVREVDMDEVQRDLEAQEPSGPRSTKEGNA